MWTLGVNNLGVQKFVAKIGCDNKPSLTLFHKLGFTEVWFHNLFFLYVCICDNLIPRVWLVFRQEDEKSWEQGWCLWLDIINQGWIQRIQKEGPRVPRPSVPHPPNENFTFRDMQHIA